MRRPLQTTLTLLFAALLLAPAAWGQQTQKLVPDDTTGDKRFGTVVSSNATGSRFITGARLDDEAGGNAGAAYIYNQNADGTYSQEAKLTANDANGAEQFGHDVAMDEDGDYVVIGARFEDINGDNDPNTGDNFEDEGAAYVFSRNTDGTWTQDDKLVAGDAAVSDLFGGSVSIDGDGAFVVVGAYLDDFSGNTNAGSGYAFSRNTDDTWEQIDKFTANDANGREQFGWSASMEENGETVLIGARLEDLGDMNDQGAGYVFARNITATDTAYTQIDKFTANDAAGGDRLGQSVSYSDDGQRAFAGAYLDDFDGNDNAGSAYAFERSVANADTTFTQTDKLTADDANGAEQFGFSVSTDETGDRVVVGTRLEDLYGDNDSNTPDAFEDEGAAYVFSGEDTYTQTSKLIVAESDAAVGDQLGSGVVLSDGVSSDQRAFVGAWRDDVNPDDVGSVYAFGPQAIPVELVAFDGTADGEGAAQLSWRTATETGNDRFEILKGSGEGDWQKIGERQGAGTTTEAQTYSFHVSGLTPGAHTFRLRQVDRDGTATLSQVVSVQVGMTERAQLNAPFPNPTHGGDATVQFAVKEQAPVTVTLHDALGRQVRTLFEGTPEAAGQLQQVRIEAGSLSSGLYLVRLEGAGGVSATETVTVVQ